MSMYLLVTTTVKRHEDGEIVHDSHTDDYSAHESLREARVQWDIAMTQTNLYSAHLCVCVDSTDYDTVRDCQWK